MTKPIDWTELVTNLRGTKAVRRRALRALPRRLWWGVSFADQPHHARCIQLDIDHAGRFVACPAGIGGRRGRKRRRAKQRLAEQRWAREQARLSWPDDGIPF